MLSPQQRNDKFIQSSKISWNIIKNCLHLNPSFFFYTYLRHLCLLSRMGSMTICRLEITRDLHISIRKWYPFISIMSNSFSTDCFGLTKCKPNIILALCFCYSCHNWKQIGNIALPEAKVHLLRSEFKIFL